MRHQTEFTGLTLHQVRDEFCSEDFLVAFATEVGVEVETVALRHEEHRTLADMPWSFPTDREGIPSLARKFLPKEVRLDWRQEWGPAVGDVAEGRIHVELHGSPSASITGDAHLRASGDSVVYTVNTAIKTSLPRLMKKAVEPTIDKDLVGWILQVQSRVLRRRHGQEGA